MAGGKHLSSCCFSNLTRPKTSIRYAKNASGHVGVIPENYVQALADPPEPNEPPPSFSTFSTANHSMDTFNHNANTSRSSYQSNADPPLYMNPVVTNSWQPPELPSWSPAQRPVRYLDESLSFSRCQLPLDVLLHSLPSLLANPWPGIALFFLLDVLFFLCFSSDRETTNFQVTSSASLLRWIRHCRGYFTDGSLACDSCL